MPTFHDPLADAAETSEALRGLAHASRVFDDPADTYPVVADLLAGLRSLRQVLDQLATTHLTHQARANDDDGDHHAGAASALAAADELHQAATFLDDAGSRLDAAFTHSGRIAWHPAVEEPRPMRWVSVVFLQGDEADEVLDLIDRDGADAAIEHLKGWDYGEETTDAAVVNGYVYDAPPTGPLDRAATGNGYLLTYSHAYGHVGLLREHTTAPDPALDDPTVAPAREPITEGPNRPAPTARRERVRRPPEASWYSHPATTETKPSHGLSR